MAVKLTVDTNETAALSVAEAESVSLNAESSILIDRTTVYEGPYEWTPTDSAQTITIVDEKAIKNITINPIPSNYGLITWDGTTLTVS